MRCFLIDGYRDTGSIDGAMPCKSRTDDFMGWFQANQVIELQADAFKHTGARMDAHGFIIVQRAVIRDTDFNDRVDITAGFDFAIGIGGIAHQRRPAEFEVAEIVGMVDDLRTVRIRVQRAIVTAVPHTAVGRIAHIALIAVECFGNEGFRFQFTPL